MTLRGAARQVEAERAARRTAAGVECWAPLPACPGCGHVVRRDVTQADLARSIGASQNTVGRIVAGVGYLSVDQLVALADALGVEPAKLLVSTEGMRAARARQLRALADAIESGSD